MRPEGIEPPAYRFEACRSIQLSYGRTEDRETLVGDVREEYPCGVPVEPSWMVLEYLFALAVSSGVGAASLLHHHTSGR